MSAPKSAAPTVGRRALWRAHTTDPDVGERSPRTASLVAGIGLLAMAILTPYAHFLVLDGLFTPGDAVRTMEAIAGSEGLFRSGVVSLAVVAVLDVVVAAALFHLFAPVNRVASMFAAWLRLAYAAVFMVAVAMLAGVLPLADDQDKAVQGIDVFYDVWHAGLILFGAHLMAIGYLAYRSVTMPGVIGVLCLVAGAGYLFDRFGALMLSDYSLTIATFTGPGEVALAFWLLLKGVRSPSPADRPLPANRAAVAV
jgi:hypothetical protein